MAITTHILDVSRGKPAANVTVVLEHFVLSSGIWQHVGTVQTNADGRTPALTGPSHAVVAGKYRLTFQTGDYCAAHNMETFYPEVQVQFTVRNPTEHHHVPLLLSPFGYSTYRGS